MTHTRCTLVVSALVACSCGPASSDLDVSVDTGIDPDPAVDPASDPVEENTGCTECPEGQTCLSRVRGRLLYEDGTPVTGVESVIKFHIGICYYTEPDEDGYFEITKGCYDVVDPLFLEVPSVGVIDDAFTRYAVEFLPSQEQISDEGPDDFVLDVGTVYWWSKPAPSSSYTASAGASVDEAGVQFDVPPGALGEDPLELGVFAFPLDEWVPPFIANPFSAATVDHADALYYLSPYWQQVTGDGLVLRIDPPEGWTEGDTGTVHLLGDWVWHYVELPGLGEIDIGRVVELGPVTHEAGKLVTPPIPILGWVILVKD